MSFLEQLTKTLPAKKVFFLLLAMMALGALFLFFGYFPVSEELSQLERKHSALQRKLQNAERKRKTYEEDRLKRDDLKKASTKQLQMLPPDTEMSSFLNNINVQADLVGLKIISVNPLSEESAEYYARIPVKLKLEGSFHQLAKFFYLVGNLDRIINIENIRLGNTKLDESGVIMTAEVMATTFRSITTDKKKKK